MNYKQAREILEVDKKTFNKMTESKYLTIPIKFKSKKEKEVFNKYYNIRKAWEYISQYKGNEDNDNDPVEHYESVEWKTSAAGNTYCNFEGFNVTILPEYCSVDNKNLKEPNNKYFVSFKMVIGKNLYNNQTKDFSLKFTYWINKLLVNKTECKTIALDLITNVFSNADLSNDSKWNKFISVASDENITDNLLKKEIKLNKVFIYNFKLSGFLKWIFNMYPTQVLNVENNKYHKVKFDLMKYISERNKCMFHDIKINELVENTISEEHRNIIKHWYFWYYNRRIQFRYLIPLREDMNWISINNFIEEKKVSGFVKWLFEKYGYLEQESFDEDIIIFHLVEIIKKNKWFEIMDKNDLIDCFSEFELCANCKDYMNKCWNDYVIDNNIVEQDQMVVNW